MKKILATSILVAAGFMLGGCNDSTTPSATNNTAPKAGVCQEYFDLVKKCTASLDKTYADQYDQSMKMVEQQIASMPKEQAEQVCKMSLDSSKTAFAQMGCK